ncbi:MAG: stage II sporulation protein R [Lachnospiraceae bacterium]|nr:stage II sporulation protein R [Lachnospiraceae bacterium]
MYIKKSKTYTCKTVVHFISSTYKSFVSSFIFSISMLILLYTSYPHVVARDLSPSIVRLHVRANSDDSMDQLLKLKVRDSIIEYLQANMNATNREDAVTFLKNNSDTIVAIAQKTVLDNGYNYSVKINIGYDMFPDKYYGKLFFPKGEYYSLNVNIGSGSGHNWWCVLYPPLCLIDNVTAHFDNSSQNYIRSHTTKSEYDYMNSDEDTGHPTVFIRDNPYTHRYEYTAKPKFKFRYLTFLNRFVN